MSALDQLLLKKYQQSVASTRLPVVGQQFDGDSAAFEETTLDADASALLNATEGPQVVEDDQFTQSSAGSDPSAEFASTGEQQSLTDAASPPDQQDTALMTDAPNAKKVESSSKSTFAQAIAIASQYSETTNDKLSSEQEAGTIDELLVSPDSPRDEKHDDSGRNVASEAEPELATSLSQVVTANLVEVVSTPDAKSPLIDETKGASQAASRTEPQAFRPQWEVDRFRWPATCCEIDQRVVVELDAAVRSLHPADCYDNTALLVQGHRANLGRSTVALCLARRAAMAQLRVALVDLDYEQPSLMKSLGVASEFGIESLHLDQTAESICIAAVEDGVTLCPLVKAIPPDGEAATAMLESLIEHYDLVVIDAAPGIEALLNPRLSLEAIIVEDDREGESAAESTKMLARKLRSKNIVTAGVVKNFAA